MKPDKDKIKAAIAGMNSICAGRRKEVTALVESIIGEPLTPPPAMDYKLRVGDVWRAGGYNDVVILSTYGGRWFLGGGDLLPFSNCDRGDREEVQEFLKGCGFQNIGRIKLIWPS